MVARGAKGSNGMALMVWLERPLGQNGLSQKGYVRSAFCAKPQTKLYITVSAGDTNAADEEMGVAPGGTVLMRLMLPPVVVF